jgi:hypothetical protein
MRKGIRLGTMLIADGTRIPQSVPFASARYSRGWSSITSAQLDPGLEKAGWAFFYMTGEIRTSGWGFDVESRIVALWIA